MRAYELMVIFDGGLDDDAFRGWVDRISEQIGEAGGRVASTDPWGKRRFAYEIDHKWEGFYVVIEVLAEGAVLDDLERSLRLADDVVRHKLIRLPDGEAARRGLIAGAPTPAEAG